MRDILTHHTQTNLLTRTHTYIYYLNTRTQTNTYKHLHAHTHKHLHAHRDNISRPHTLTIMYPNFHTKTPTCMHYEHNPAFTHKLSI